MNRIFAFCAFLVLISSCKDNTSSGFTDLDLMSYGMPIKIKAPENPIITKDDLGIVKEVTIKGDNEYYVQILSGQAYSGDIKVLVDRQKGDATTMKYFSKMIEENDQGFIFEKSYPELNRITYDFRYIKLQGDYQYTFQAGLMGQYTLDQVKAMYNSVQ